MAELRRRKGDGDTVDGIDKENDDVLAYDKKYETEPNINEVSDSGAADSGAADSSDHVSLISCFHFVFCII